MTVNRKRGYHTTLTHEYVAAKYPASLFPGGFRQVLVTVAMIVLSAETDLQRCNGPGMTAVSPLTMATIAFLLHFKSLQPCKVT